jgi:hypothetical protein
MDCCFGINVIDYDKILVPLDNIGLTRQVSEVNIQTTGINRQGFSCHFGSLRPGSRGLLPGYGLDGRLCRLWELTLHSLSSEI